MIQAETKKQVVKGTKGSQFCHGLLLLVLFAVLTFTSGCTEMVILAGEKAYAHLRGDLLGVIPEKLDKVYAASLEAATHLDHYQVLDYKLTAINGTITALDRDAEKTTIELTRTETDGTQIQIRIGAFGDKIKSVYLYDSIRQQLNAPKVARAPF
jgi:hypothetical protein